MIVVWLLCTAAVRVQYPGTTDAQISAKVGAFLAQSADRDGGRKERALKKEADDRAAAVSPRSDLEAAGDADDDADADDEQ